MDKQALSAAKECLRRATSEVERLRQGGTFDTLKEAWSDFLSDTQRCFTKLRAAAHAGPSKGWYDGIENVRRTDEMLSYVRHARNADEHGIEEITNTSFGSASFGVRGFARNIVMTSKADGTTEVSYESNDPVSIKIKPASIGLVAVRNRGATYVVPRTHLGNALVCISPLQVAELTLSFLQKAVGEAEQFP
jgi:hypothetical protein